MREKKGEESSWKEILVFVVLAIILISFDFFFWRVEVILCYESFIDMLIPMFWVAENHESDARHYTIEKKWSFTIFFAEK